MASYNITIVGAGSIGGFLGVKLALSDSNVKVNLIARGKHLEAIKENGLKLIMADGEELVARNCFATADMAEIKEKQDVVIIAVKAQQVPPIAEKLQGIISDDTMVVTMQNGIPWWYFQNYSGPTHLANTVIKSVDPEGVLLKSIHPKSIIGCTVYPACHIVEPGVIQHTEGFRFPIGELDGSKSERIEKLSKVMTIAGFKAFILDDIRSEIWLKLWGTMVFNPLSALTHGTLEEICTFSDTKDLATMMMKESQSIAEYLGASFRVGLEKRIEGAAKVGAHKTSMCQDIENGRSIEVDAILGSVLELGKLSNINIPHITTIHACCQLLNKVVMDHKVAVKPVAW